MQSTVPSYISDLKAWKEKLPSLERKLGVGRMPGAACKSIECLVGIEKTKKEQGSEFVV